MRRINKKEMRSARKNVPQYSKKPTTLEIRVMHFIEHLFFAVRAHPIANIVISVFFFGSLYLNTIAMFLTREKNYSLNPICINIICFIVSLNSKDAGKAEIEESIIFVTFIICFMFIISVLTFSSSFYAMNVFSSAFKTLILYILPIIMIMSCKTYQISYHLIETVRYSLINYFSIIGHNLLLFLSTMTTLFAYLSPYICKHPFFQRNILSCCITFFYYFATIHNDSFFSDNWTPLLIFRMFCSLFACVLIVVVIPFYNVHLTAALFSHTIFSICSSISLLVMPTREIFCLYYLIVAFGLTFLIFYVIIPKFHHQIYPRRDIFFAYFFNRKEEVEQLLSEIDDPYQIDIRYISEVIMISFDMDSPKLPQLLEYYMNNRETNIFDTFHMWIIYNLYNSVHDCRTPVLDSFIKSNENKIHKLYKKFWFSVWLSELADLPSIAGELGRRKMDLYIFVSHYENLYSTVFPSNFNRPPLTNIITHDDDRREISTKYQVTQYFGWNEVFLIFTYVFYIIFLIIALICMMRLRNQCYDYEDDFYSFFQYYSKYQLMQDNASLERLNYLFNNSISTEIKNIHKYYLDSHFISAYYALSGKLGAVGIYGSITEMSIFMNTTDNMLANFPAVFNSVFDSENALLQRIASCYYVIILAIAVIMSILFFIVLKRRIIQYSQRFLSIPKSDIALFNKAEFSFNSFEQIHVKRGFSLFLSYPVTTTLHFLYLLCSVVFVVLLAISAKTYHDSIISAEDNFYISSNAYRIPVKLIMAAYIDTDINLDCAQSYTNLFLSESMMHTVMSNFPQSFYDVIGNYIFMNIKASISTIYSIVNQINVLVRKETPLITVRDQFYYKKLILRVVLMFLFVVLMILIILPLKSLAQKERQMIEILYKEFIEFINNQRALENEEYTYGNDIDISDFETSEEHSASSISVTNGYFLANKKKKVKTKPNIREIPMSLIVINSKFHVIFQTNLATDELGVKNGESFKNTKISMASLKRIQNAYNKYLTNATNKMTAIPFGDHRSLIIKPVFKDAKTLDHIILVNSMEPPNASIEITNKLNRIFYSIYPNFILLKQRFPFELDSNGRPFFLLFVKLSGFNEWCDSNDIKIVMRFRKDISRVCNDLLNDDSNLHRIREQSDKIVLMMNRDIKLSMWTIIESFADFTNRLINKIEEIASNYHVSSVIPTALLFKIREPDYYFTKKKCAFPDFTNGYIFLGEERLPYCKLGIVNYTSLRKELKANNTTKLKTCRTPDGDEYDLFVVI